MKPAAVLLAAGASRRLGRPKQLLELDAEPMVRRAARICLEVGFEPVLAVLGSGAAEVEAALDGLAVRCLDNPEWPEGMAASIRAGLAALPGEATAVLLLACDQPTLSAALLREFRRLHQDRPEAVLASAYNGGRGIPALFPRSRLEALASLRGDRGAKALLGEAELIPFPGGEIDFDTPEDVEAWLRR